MEARSERPEESHAEGCSEFLHPRILCILGFFRLFVFLESLFPSETGNRCPIFNEVLEEVAQGCYHLYRASGQGFSPVPFLYPLECRFAVLELLHQDSNRHLSEQRLSLIKSMVCIVVESTSMREQFLSDVHVDPAFYIRSPTQVTRSHIDHSTSRNCGWRGYF